MANPTRSMVHIDRAATNLSIAYRNTEYIADQIMPIVSVADQTASYFKFDKASWFRNEAAPRAPGTRGQRVEYTMDTAGTYRCVDTTAVYFLPDETRQNATSPLQPERTASELVTDKVLLAREVRVAALVFSGTYVTNTATAAALTGGAQVAWDTFETSDPLQDVNVMSHNVIAQIGRKPNVMVVGVKVYQSLRVHPVVKECVKYTNTIGLANEATLANLFDVEKFLVGRPIYTTSEEGVTATYSNIWTTNVLLAWVPPRPALEVPAFGYIVEWKNRVINRFRDDQAHSDVFECTENTDEIVTSTDAAYLLTAVVT